MTEAVEIAVSTMLFSVSGVPFHRRREMALWLQENPWLDQIDAGSVIFHFKGDSVIPKYEIMGRPRKAS